MSHVATANSGGFDIVRDRLPAAEAVSVDYILGSTDLDGWEAIKVAIIRHECLEHDNSVFDCDAIPTEDKNYSDDGTLLNLSGQSSYCLASSEVRTWPVAPRTCLSVERRRPLANASIAASPTYNVRSEEGPTSDFIL